jgi:hypothetical protein
LCARGPAARALQRRRPLPVRGLPGGADPAADGQLGPKGGPRVPHRGPPRRRHRRLGRPVPAPDGRGVQPDRQQHCHVQVLQVHREQGRGQAGAQGSRPEEDSFGNRG